MIPYSALLLLLLVASTTRAGGTIWDDCLSGEWWCVAKSTCFFPGAPAGQVPVDEMIPFLAYYNQRAATCEAQLQIKPRTPEEWLVHIKGSTALEPATGLHLYYDDGGGEPPILLAGCKDPGTGVIAEGKDGLGVELQGSESSLTTTGGTCSLRIADATSLSSLPLAYLIIKYKVGGQDAEMKTKESYQMHIEVGKYFYCDPSVLTATFAAVIPGFKKISILDPFAKEIACPQGSKLYAGTVSGFSDAHETTEITCNKPAKKFEYKKDGGLETYDALTDEIFCTVPIDTTCEPLAQDATIAGPTLKEDPTTKAKRLECASAKDRVFINDEFYVTDARKLQCKNRDKPDENGAWYAVSSDGLSTPVETAECTEKYKCLSSTFTSGPPNSTQPKGDKKMYGKVKKNDTIINCRSAEMSLVVLQDRNTTTYKPESIVCDGENGQWVMRTGQDVVMQGDANVYCERVGSPSPSAAVITGASSATFSRLSYPFVVLAGIVGAIAVYCKRRIRWPKVVPPPPVKELPPPVETEEEKLVRLAEAKAARRRFLAERMIVWQRAQKAWRPWEYELCPKGWNNVAPRAKRAFVKFIIKRYVPPVTHPDYLPMPRDTEEDERAWAVEAKKLEADYEFRKPKRKFSPSALMEMINCLFDYEYSPHVWKQMLPFLFFIERDLFHADQTNDLSKVEKNRKIPAHFYEHFRRYLLRKSAEVIKRFDDGIVTEMVEKEDKKEEKKRDAGGKEDNDDDKKDGDDEEAEKEVKKKPPPPDPNAEAEPVTGQVSGFVKAIALLIQYKLLTDKDEKEKLLDRIFADYKKDRMSMKGASRMAVWGILRHEDCPITRRRGVHEYFGPASKSTVMLDDLLEEFNNLLKKDGDFPRTAVGEGTKLQHVLFAMGCSTERTAMAEVWKALNSDERFMPEDFMWSMYGRDWLWDGAWCAMTQKPNENYLFSKRFGQDCAEYRELAEMCTRYWADKYSKDAKKGYRFETLALQCNKHFRIHSFLRKIYARAELWERNRRAYAEEMFGWLRKHDGDDTPAEFTAKGDELTDEAKAKPATAESKELAALANRAVPKDKPKPPQEQPSSDGRRKGRRQGQMMMADDRRTLPAPSPLP